MPYQDRKLSLKSQAKNKISQLNYEFTSARKEALKKAQEASAEARKLASGAVGGSQNTLSKAQVIANRFINRVTGSNTSALKKRQQAKAQANKIKAQVSTTANTAGSTARALTGTAASMYKGYKAEATKKINRTISDARGNISYKMNQSTADAYKAAGASRGSNQTGTSTLKAGYTQAGQSMQAGKNMLAAKNANRSKAGPTGKATTMSAYNQGAGNTSKTQFISRQINRMVKNGTKPATARRTAENLWKQKQANDRKNKRVK